MAQVTWCSQAAVERIHMDLNAQPLGVNNDRKKIVCDGIVVLNVFSDWTNMMLLEPNLSVSGLIAGQCLNASAW